MAISRGADDTIYAVASGQGRAAIAVLRLSGSGAARAGGHLLCGPLPPARRASLRTLHGPDRAPLDQAVVLWLPGPASFTGEDQLELHLHGGTAVKTAVLRALADIEGCRPAEPGEFTRRAFLAGRIDLPAAEGLADLIDAETEEQRKQAIRQMGGALSAAVAGWRERLADILAGIEATLDFSDEGDVPDADLASWRRSLREIGCEVARALAAAAQGERLRDGAVVVIAGPPNAGKSTLLNAIARRDVAIVSHHPGTTRDAIEVRCDLAGLPVTFVDTAGLREATDPVEREGVARTRARAAEADLVLLLTPSDQIEAGSTLAGEGVATERVMRVCSKADLGTAATHFEGFAISAMTGAGLATLLDGVAQRLGPRSGADAIVTRERHRLALARVVDCLARAGAAGHNDHLELVAEDVRSALRALAGLVGEVDVEDLLDRIFARFCIGK